MGVRRSGLARDRLDRSVYIGPIRLNAVMTARASGHYSEKERKGEAKLEKVQA